jgi:predicted AAA+ superfamily ATPase
MIEDISILRQAMTSRLQATETKFHRFLYHKINWENRLIGIRGYRGVGKTTLVLQHIKETFPNRQVVLYASLDHGWFQTHSLYDLAMYHQQHGGTHLFLDEIHHYNNWQTEIKNIYDDFPTLYIVFTGSSMLHINTQAGDLSRRLRLYTMPVMSLREYIAIETGVEFSAYSLDQILSDSVNIASFISEQHIIQPLFESYLNNGCYPFYKEKGDGFEQRLQETIWLILERDWPALEDVNYSTIQKTKRLLMVLSEAVPLTPNMTELFAAVETNREGGLRMLYTLEKAGVLRLITREPRSIGMLRKPDKIYLGNSNLMHALSSNTNIGTIRETFFCNQLTEAGHGVYLAKKGDFFVDSQYTFEVGGASKTFKQISGVKNSFLAIDNTSVGDINRIPLWLFGFLY